MASHVLSAMEAEWSRLARNPRARRTVVRWARKFPVLTGLRDLADVLERRRDHRAAPAVLTALSRMAPTDDLAARTLLHALVPGLVRLAHLTASDDPAALDEMVSLAWERIRTYPSGRRGSVAANVLLDVRHAYRQQRNIEAPKSAPLPVELAATTLSAEDEAVQRVLFRQVVDARARLARQRRGLVSERLWQLVVLTRFAGVPLAEMAQSEGVSRRAMSKRRWQAEQRLQRELLMAG